MQDLHVELGQFFQPPRQLTVWIFESHKPGEAVMVGTDKESPAQQIVTELACKRHNGQELLSGDTISTLSRDQPFAGEAQWADSTVLNLG